ncbi:hypothetical protein DL96DRAFT_327646 [Flagelloscypha sp. PMI_526]|nr:hypothetical protein DL96DRAFT_327646 [Flagelloscypha sp. PMI_526]
MLYKTILVLLPAVTSVAAAACGAIGGPPICPDSDITCRRAICGNQGACTWCEPNLVVRSGTCIQGCCAIGPPVNILCPGIPWTNEVPRGWP